MEEKKTPEEILNSFDIIVYKDSPDTSDVAFSNEDTKSAMREYASQQSRSTAIGFALWMNEEDCQATPCGWVMSADAYKGEYSIDQIFDLYLQSLTNQK